MLRQGVFSVPLFLTAEFVTWHGLAGSFALFEADFEIRLIGIVRRTRAPNGARTTGTAGNRFDRDERKGQGLDGGSFLEGPALFATALPCMSHQRSGTPLGDDERAAWSAVGFWHPTPFLARATR